MGPILVAGPNGSGSARIAARLQGAGFFAGARCDDAFRSRPFEAVSQRFLAALLEQSGGPVYALQDIDPQLRDRITSALDAAASAHLQSPSGGGRWVLVCRGLVFFLPFLLKRFPGLHLVQIPETGPARIAEWRRDAGHGTWAEAAEMIAAFADRELGARYHRLNTQDHDSELELLVGRLGPVENPVDYVGGDREWSAFDEALEQCLVAPLAPSLPLAPYRSWIDRIEPELQKRAAREEADPDVDPALAVVLLAPSDEMQSQAAADLAGQPGCAALTLVLEPAAPEPPGWPGGILRTRTAFAADPAAFLAEIWSATGAAWAFFIEPGMRLAPRFLALLREALGRAPQADLMHGDFDFSDADGSRFAPVMKGAVWDHDLALQCDLLGGGFTISRSLGMRMVAPAPDTDGSVFVELGLIASEQAEPEAIVHIPHVLTHVSPAEPARYAAARHRALRRRGWNAVLEPGPLPEMTHVKFAVPDPRPLVSVIVPTRDGGARLARCLDGLLRETGYADLEVIVVDNGSKDPATLERLRALERDPRGRVIRHDRPFNFAEIMNAAVEEASGSVICMLNDDVFVLHRGWLAEMVGLALRPDVGIVGALLLFEDGTVQHAGVTLGLLGHVAGHDFHYEPESRLRRHPRYALARQTSAVTAACAVLRRDVYEQVGGMDAEHLAVNYNDLDLCLKIGEAGFKVLWTPYARLIHAESATRGKEDLARKMARSNAEGGLIAARWAGRIAKDPFTNPNLSIEHPAFELSFLLSGAGSGSEAAELSGRERLLEDAREVARDAGILPDNLAFHAAKIAHHRGRDDLAARLTLEAVLQAPGAYTANLVAGTCLTKVGELERALLFYRNANLISPQAVRPWLYRGLLAERLGRAGEARDFLTATLRHDPFNERAKAALERLSR
ncbi:glycosyltransferase family 2 protein [Nisaea sediminum]|uniref:glycosyltransferase family 2 protein n=1 Tax=Nisaea sediminum TaxID=2775867 RepID=UPI0018696817|nr:glycosyltransferase family 2 protein [Nisaea sediminum]